MNNLRCLIMPGFYPAVVKGEALFISVDWLGIDYLVTVSPQGNYNHKFIIFLDQHLLYKYFNLF